MSLVPPLKRARVCGDESDASGGAGDADAALAVWAAALRSPRVRRRGAGAVCEGVWGGCAGSGAAVLVTAPFGFSADTCGVMRPRCGGGGGRVLALAADEAAHLVDAGSLRLGRCDGVLPREWPDGAPECSVAAPADAAAVAAAAGGSDGGGGNDVAVDAESGGVGSSAAGPGPVGGCPRGRGRGRGRVRDAPDAAAEASAARALGALIGRAGLPVFLVYRDLRGRGFAVFRHAALGGGGDGGLQSHVGIGGVGGSGRCGGAREAGDPCSCAEEAAAVAAARALSGVAIFDVWCPPEGSPFRKSAPGPPDSYVVVVDGGRAPVPRVADVARARAALRAAPHAPLRFGVVSGGSVAYVSVGAVSVLPALDG